MRHMESGECAVPSGSRCQLADALRALARAVHNHPDTPRSPEAALLVVELRSAAWEQAGQHTLHYVLDDLRALYESVPGSERGCGSCR